MEVRKKRMVVVGVGSIGLRHLRLLAERDDICVEICESNASAVAHTLDQLGQFPVHSSFEQMIGTSPDMVLIATPPELHYQQTVDALECGAHVLCEKPMTATLEEAIGINQLKLKESQILSYGFSFHFHPGLVKTKELIDSGRLGEIQYAYFHIGTYDTMMNSKSKYQCETEGALLMDYVHQPDLLYWILGINPVGLYAAGSAGGRREFKSSPNSITFTMDYQNDLISTIHLDYLQSPDHYYFEFIGDQGWIFYDLMSNTLQLGDTGSKSVDTKKIQVVRDDIYREEHQRFLDAVEGKGRPESTPSEAVNSMMVAKAAHKSWKSKQRILMTDILP